MKKFLSFFALAAVLVCVSCTPRKVTISYGYDATSLQVHEDYKVEAASFMTDITSAMEAFDGVLTTDAAVIAAFDPIVERYQNKHIKGKFYLTKWEGTSSLPEIIKTYTIVGTIE